MTDSRDEHVQPVTPVGAVHSVPRIAGSLDPAPVRVVSEGVRPRGQQAAAHTQASADVATEGQLPSAYAQFAVDPDTRQVIVKIRDAATDRVLTELPPQTVQAVDKSLREYAEFLARHRAMSTKG